MATTTHQELAQRLQGLNLYLVGMMGTGKSAVGRPLADALGYRFVDADTVLEGAAGCTISTTCPRGAFRPSACWTPPVNWNWSRAAACSGSPFAWNPPALVEAGGDPAVLVLQPRWLLRCLGPLAQDSR